MGVASHPVAGPAPAATLWDAGHFGDLLPPGAPRPPPTIKIAVCARAQPKNIYTHLPSPWHHVAVRQDMEACSCDICPANARLSTTKNASVCQIILLYEYFDILLRY